MAIDFPASPVLNQTYTFGSRTWKWSGYGWMAVTTTYGPQGVQGIQGTQGLQGLLGTQGLIGTQGTQGLQGTLGTQGTLGSQGTQGTVGSQGTLGSQGTQGTVGSQGVQGITGTQGVQGTQGTQGLQGTQGTTGIQGYTGLQGVVGTQGVQGPQGTQGIQGIQGVQGTQGVNGNQGTIGTQGLQGVQGTQGTQGIQGTQGKIGDDGFVAQTEPPTNTSLLWLDTDEPAASLNLGTTSSPGILQLTDSTSSTSTTTAATANAVKTAYDAAIINPYVAKYTGVYYKTPITSLLSTNIVNNDTYYTPIFVSQTTSFDRLALRTASAFAGTSTVRLGIYSDINGAPSTLILDAGTVICTAATTIYEITISQSLQPGIYWLAFCQQETAPTQPYYTGNGLGGTLTMNGFISGEVVPNSNQICGFVQHTVTGSFANATSLYANVITPYVWIRAT